MGANKKIATKKESTQTNRQLRLLCFVDSRCPELLSHFIRHYQSLGLSSKDFYLIFHQQLGKADKLTEKSRQILTEAKIKISRVVDTYTSEIKRDEINNLLTQVAQKQDWILYVDLDEFLELPTGFQDLPTFAQYCDQEKYEIVRGLMVDRISMNGELTPIQINRPIDKQYPISCYLTKTVQGSNYCKAFLVKGKYRFFNSHYTTWEMKQRLEIRTVNDLRLALKGKAKHAKSGARLKGKYPKKYYPKLLSVAHYKWTQRIKEHLEERFQAYRQLQENDRMQGNAHYYERALKHLKTNRISLDLIHLIYSSDQGLIKPLIVSMHSVLKNQSQPEKIFFHLVLDSKKTKEKFLKQLQKTLLARFTFQYEIKIPLANRLQQLQREIRVTKDQSNISSIMNFARFLFPELFPTLNRIVYIDVDMICQGDLTDLYHLDLNDEPLAALRDKRFEQDMGPQFLTQHPKYNPKYIAFNAGLYVTDLNYWRKAQIWNQVLQIMREHKNSQSAEGHFKYGTQPIMNLVFYRQYQPLQSHWHVKNLGYQKGIKKQKLDHGKIIHWNGPLKPWFRNGLYQKRWDRYSFWKGDRKPLSKKNPK